MKAPLVKYRKLREGGRFHGTFKRAVAVWESRQEQKNFEDPLTKPLVYRWNRLKVLVPVVPGHEVNVIVSALHDSRPRVQNWTSPKASYGVTRVNEMDCGPYSSRVKYHRISYVPAITSYAVLQGRTLVFRFDTRRILIKAPRGYCWGRDDNGVKLYSKSNPANDYHPNTSDLLGSTKAIVQKLKANVLARKEAEKQSKQTEKAFKRAVREGAMVCMADSLQSGNCYSGTYNWATRHGLNPSSHYTPDQLSAIANGDARRVALVVTVALRRHSREMERGYCVLAEHGK